MTDETKKPDEIDQAALDAHPEEQPGNAAGGASSDEQSTEGSAAPVADGASDEGNAAAAAADGEQAAGDAPVGGGDVGNVSETQPSSPLSSSPSSTQTLSAESQTESQESASSAGSLSSDSSSVTGAASGEPLPLGAGGVIVPVADSTPEDQAQLAAADKVGATVEDDSGNVVAGGAQGADGTASENETSEHPVKSRARQLRRKIEAEEAIVMADLLAVLRDIEEAL